MNKVRKSIQDLDSKTSNVNGKLRLWKKIFKKLRNVVNEKSINQPNEAVKINTDQLKKNKEYQHGKQNWGNIIFNQQPRKRNKYGYNIQELWNMIKILKITELKTELSLN